jgi:hypothetical protein
MIELHMLLFYFIRPPWLGFDPSSRTRGLLEGRDKVALFK